MEVDKPREIVILILTGHAHYPVQDHGEHVPGLILQDREPGRLHAETAPMDDEILHHHNEEGGEEGVLATPAFQATAIGAVVGVVVDMDAVGARVLGPI